MRNATIDECPVRVRADKIMMSGDLCVPEGAKSLVLFAHGSGSSRQSPRNKYVAGVLREAGIATLLFDLLTADEETEDLRTARLRFDIGLLAKRLIGATDWVKERPETRDMNAGYFGASTGSAAALVAAAHRPELVDAVVSRGGRPDLAAGWLSMVRAPTLLVVGGMDYAVIGMNRAAMGKMTAERRMVIVPGATHLFEEPGTLEEVAALARDWFRAHLKADAKLAGARV